MIALTFILDQALIDLADEFPCQRDPSLVKPDPTLFLHLLDERLVRCIDTVIASKVIPVNVVGTLKVKVSTQGGLRLLQVEDLRIEASSADLFHDRMSTTVDRTPLGCHNGLHGRGLLDVTSKGGDFRDDDDYFELFARLSCLKDTLNERLGNLVGNGAGVLGVRDAVD